MPANTARGYPYPLGTDRVMDGDDSIKALADKINLQLGAAASGNIPNILSNGSVQSTAVTFPAGRFVNAPNVVVSTNAGASTTNPALCGVGSPTTTGVTITVNRASGGVLTAYWIAIDV